MATMTHVTITPTTVVVRFTRGEKIAGLIADQAVDRRHITSVTVVPDGLAATRGLRAPGLGLPGVRKIGTWRGRGQRTLVSVRRGEPALAIDLSGGRYTRLLLGSPDAQAWADALAPAGAGAPAGRE
jgi:hypothetical protein